MSHGGARTGAGRPKGAKNLRRFQDYWTDEEIATFIEAGKDRYMDSDKIYVEFLQQIFGKAQQTIDLYAEHSHTFDEETLKKAKGAIGEIMGAVSAW